VRQVNLTWGDLHLFVLLEYGVASGDIYPAVSGNALVLLDILALEDEITTLPRKPGRVYLVLHHHYSRKTGTSSSQLIKSKN
jgi:hypothetical protein